PDGIVARFSSSYVVDDTVIAAFDSVYREFAPSVAQVWRPTMDLRASQTTDHFKNNPAFVSVETRAYRWECTLSADECVGLARTISDPLRLGPQRLSTLAQALRTTIQGLGGTIHAYGEARLVLARRSAAPMATRSYAV